MRARFLSPPENPTFQFGKTFMKRLSSRLAALEATQNTNELSAPERRLLVSILARRDSLFWPWRYSRGSQIPFCEIRTRQKEYLSGAAGTAVKADGAANWKASHELRQRLISSGLVTAVYGGGQILSVFLTAEGEGVARALVGSRLHQFHESGIIVLARLQGLSTQTKVRAVRESVLWGHEYLGDPSDWNHMTEMILPCLTAGLVQANSDTEGRACFTPIDGVPEPPEITVNVVADESMDALYLKSFASELSVLKSMEPRDPHEVYIPLPATGWGWPCFFPGGDYHGKG